MTFRPIEEAIIAAKGFRPIIDPISHLGVLLKFYDDDLKHLKGTISKTNSRFSSYDGGLSSESRGIIAVSGDFNNDLTYEETTDLSILSYNGKD